MNRIQKLLEENQQKVTFDVNFFNKRNYIEGLKVLNKISDYIEISENENNLNIHIKTYLINVKKINNVLSNNITGFHTVTNYGYVE